MSGIHLQAPGSSILRKIDEFFMKTGPVQQTLHNLDKRLSEEKIDYAVIGGMALALHGFVRPTLDVDILLTKEGLQRFHEVLVGRGYVPAFSGARKHFRDTETGVNVEVITAGEYPGDGKPKPVVFPDPSEVVEDKGEYPVVKLETLIELKLACGLSAEHRQLRDLADVQQLIEVLELPEELSRQLDESVRNEYSELWRRAQQAREHERESG